MTWFSSCSTLWRLSTIEVVRYLINCTADLIIWGFDLESSIVDPATTDQVSYSSAIGNRFWSTNETLWSGQRIFWTRPITFTSNMTNKDWDGNDIVIQWHIVLYAIVLYATISLPLKSRAVCSYEGFGYRSQCQIQK